MSSISTGGNKPGRLADESKDLLRISIGVVSSNMTAYPVFKLTDRYENFRKNGQSEIS